MIAWLKIENKHEILLFLLFIQTHILRSRRVHAKWKWNILTICWVSFIHFALELYIFFCLNSSQLNCECVFFGYSIYSKLNSIKAFQINLFWLLHKSFFRIYLFASKYCCGVIFVFNANRLNWFHAIISQTMTYSNIANRNVFYIDNFGSLVTDFFKSLSSCVHTPSVCRVFPAHHL